MARYASTVGVGTVKLEIGRELAGARSRALQTGAVVTFEQARDAIATSLGRRLTQSLIPVLNGTGILLHTNLGRAPLSRAAVDAMGAIGAGYSNLEFDLHDGSRGSRYGRVSDLLRETTGAQDGLVVNNCAAAMLLVLDTFAVGREVVVARGQQIEIGGGFRLPDVLTRSGATLVDVGATNKLRLSDYERAVTPRTALLLRSHTSNYRIEGFTQDVDAGELGALGARIGVPVVEDLGSGVLVDLRRFGLPYERTVRDAVDAGMSLVAFSGDKLLGGPQAGIIVGKSAYIARMRANPLVRALRVDKTTLAALGATLQAYADDASVLDIPLYAMLATPIDVLRARADRIAHALGDAVPVSVVACEGYMGGGSLPTTTIASIGVALRGSGLDALATRLRLGSPALVGRVVDGAYLVDLRTIAPSDDERVIDVVRAAA